jgi:hypothetical protein
MCPHLLIGFFPNSDKLTGVLTQELGLVINSWSMSAVPPKADIDWRFVHVRFVPGAVLRDTSKISRYSDLCDPSTARSNETPARWPGFRIILGSDFGF